MNKARQSFKDVTRKIAAKLLAIRSKRVKK